MLGLQSTPEGLLTLAGVRGDGREEQGTRESSGTLCWDSLPLSPTFLGNTGRWTVPGLEMCCNGYLVTAQRSVGGWCWSLRRKPTGCPLGAMGRGAT